MRASLSLFILPIPLVFAASHPSPALGAISARSEATLPDITSSNVSFVSRSPLLGLDDLPAPLSTPDADNGFFKVGLMMPRGWPSPSKRADAWEQEPQGAVERWDDFAIERDADVGLRLPRTYDEAKKMRRSGAKERSGEKRGLLKSLVRVTWYSGDDLKNPACGDWRLGGKWSPNNNNMICALTASWSDSKGGKPKCNDFIRLTTPNRKSIVVRVIDACASSDMSPSNSCTAGLKVADLSMAAFKKLASLNQGIIDSVKVEIIAKPGGKKWTASDIKLYGPEKY